MEYRLGLALPHVAKFNIHSPYCFLKLLYNLNILPSKKKKVFPPNINLSETDSPLLNTSSLKCKHSGKKRRNLGHWSLKPASHFGEGTWVFEVSSKCLSAQNGHPPEPTARPPSASVSEAAGRRW